MAPTWEVSVRHDHEYSILMPSGHMSFRFRWIPTLLLVMFVPLFIALGLWQLERADHKREQARIQEERARMPNLQLDATTTNLDELRYRKLRARGVYEAEGQILIENRRQGDRIGFHVITPLRITDTDTRVLVNRGWIPPAAGGAPTPAPVPDGVVVVSGASHIPSLPALVLHGGTDAARTWGNRWPYLTVELYTAVMGYELLPVVILLDPDDSGGFLRIWPQEIAKEGMHLGYAIQWFAFALIGVVVWLRLSLVKRTERRSTA